MTSLRQSAIAELERVPEDKLHIIIRFINKLMKETEAEEKVYDLDQFVMPTTERSQKADAYVRELRDNDRI